MFNGIPLEPGKRQRDRRNRESPVHRCSPWPRSLHDEADGRRSMRIEVYAERSGVSKFAGAIETAPGSGESFSYDNRWLAVPEAKPLSAFQPLNADPFPVKKMDRILKGCFQRGARRAIASRIHAPYAAYMKLSNAVGHECIGSNIASKTRRNDRGWLLRSERRNARALRETELSCCRGSQRASAFSLAGSQAKTALYRSPDGKGTNHRGLPLPPIFSNL